MKRIVTTARPNWIQKAEEVGFTFHSGGKPITAENPYGTYWDESVYYEFTLAQIEEIEAASEELHARCLDAVNFVCNNPEYLFKLQIPEHYHEYIISSWQRQDPALYGRFDLAYDGVNPPKMLEYNADTPTLAIETGVVQWLWMEEMHGHADQFNSLHDKLLARFKNIQWRMPNKTATFWLIGYENMPEERQQLLYFQDLATQAGLNAKFLDLSQVGWDGHDFVDLDGKQIQFAFKLYPWEWMMQDEFGKAVTWDTVGWVEPAWKAILSNKGLLPILHMLFPKHPNILKATWTQEEFGPGEKFFAKPILSREGQNIDIIQDGKKLEGTDGDYTGSKIYQAAASVFDDGKGNKAILGSWIVDNQSAGMIIRDGSENIITSGSRVVSHIIKD